MPTNRARNGTYLVAGRHWKVAKRLTFDTYTVDTVVAPKVKVRYEAQWPNASGNLWVDGVLVSHNAIGEPVDLSKIANSRVRELIGEAVSALTMAAAAAEAAQAPARDTKAAKAAAKAAAQEGRVAQALKKLG